jgi:hypothetical protein
MLTCLANIYINKALPWPFPLKLLAPVQPNEFTGLSRFSADRMLPILIALQLTRDSTPVPSAEHVEAFVCDRERFAKDLIKLIKKQEKKVGPGHEHDFRYAS